MSLQNLQEEIIRIVLKTTKVRVFTMRTIVARLNKTASRL